MNYDIISLITGKTKLDDDILANYEKKQKSIKEMYSIAAKNGVL